MQVCPDGPEPINSYALVAYIPDPLGEFLDRLRLQLVPTCVPNAHVTVLPPRPLNVPWPAAREAVEAGVRHFEPFEVEATEVEMFGLTSVIYIGVGDGRDAFERMHEALNGGALAYDEPYPYHPHITVAQQLACEQVMCVYEAARMRWAAFPHSRRFLVDEVVLVQNTVQNRWIDLATVKVGAVPSRVG